MLKAENKFYAAYSFGINNGFREYHCGPKL